jgi:hypothetical protein
MVIYQNKILLPVILFNEKRILCLGKNLSFRSRVQFVTKKSVGERKMNYVVMETGNTWMIKLL